MEAGSIAEERRRPRRPSWLPLWVLGVAPLLLIAAAIGLFAVLGSPGIGHRPGPPVEELAVERTTLTPGKITLKVRNDGPDAVQIAQATVNDGFVPIEGGESAIGRLQSADIALSEPWIEGEAYEITLITSTGGTVTHEIPVAAETPSGDLGFFGLMVLLGIYVGVIPVALGMLWLPWVRRIPSSWLRAVMAFTVGLLAFLAVDASLEGFELAGQSSQAFGGLALVVLGAAIAFLSLSGLSTWLSDRKARNERKAGGGSIVVGGATLSLLVAIGIGLHNLSEGLAIGSAYAVGALSLGAFLVIGFALHNTTEGLAIVAPAADRPPRLKMLVLLGLIAGAPAIVGACLGALAFNPSLAVLLLGVGAGAIIQVIVQLSPSLRDATGRLLNPVAVGGLLAGMLVMYLTGLFVSV